MSKVFKKISFDTFLYSVLPQLPKLMNFVLLPLTSPHLSTLDFAVFGTVMAFVMGFDSLKSLGLDIVLMNSFFKTPTEYRIVWKKVEAFISIWSILLTIVIGFVLYLILPSELSQNDKFLIIITTSLPSFFFAGLTKISILFYQFNQKPAPIVMRSFILGLIAVFLNYYFIAVLKIGYMGWFYSGVITGVISPLTYVYPIWVKEKLGPLYNFTRQEILEMLKVSLPILPHHYANYFLNYSDRVLLSILHIPSAQVGIYNLGYSVSGNFRLFSNAIDKVIGPLFHKNLTAASDINVIRRTVFGLAFLYILIGFLGGVWMKEFFMLLIRNNELTSAYSVAIIILFSFTTRPLHNGAQSFLFFEERTSKLWRVTFMFGMLNVVLNIIFIPIYGIGAAAVNTFICIAGSNYGVFLLKDYQQTTRIDFYPIRWMVATIVVFFVSWFLKDAVLVVKSLATVIALAIVAASILMLRKKRML